jgi:fumarate reductase flavoprotein subunit
VRNAFIYALQAAIGSAPEISFTAGTYRGSGTGYGGTLVLDVTFSDTAITNIVRISDAETDHVGDPALPIMFDWIKSHNSTSVDTVTGATFSSRAVITAVEDAAVKAGCSLAAIRAGGTPFVYTPGDKIVGEYDVIVVGAGGAGMSAAAAAAEEMGEDGTVLVIEQMVEEGGNTLVAGGSWQSVRRGDIWEPENITSTANTPWPGFSSTANKSKMVFGYIGMLETILAWEEKPFDVTSTQNTPEYKRGVHDEFMPLLRTLKQQVRYYLEEYAYPAMDAGVAEDQLTLFDSMELHLFQTYYGGLRYDLDGKAIHSNYELAYQVCARSTAAKTWLAEDSAYKFNASAGTLLGSLWKRATSADKWRTYMGIPKAKLLGANDDNEIMYRTEAYELIKVGSRVVGVKAKMYDGTEVEMSATRGVIMATGGYGDNIELVIETNNYWNPDNLDTGTLYTTNRNTSTGKGMLMSEAVGAAVIGTDFTQLMPSGRYNDGKLVGASGPSLIYIAPKGSNMGPEYEGKRYVDENAERDVLSIAGFKYGAGDRGDFIQFTKPFSWGGAPITVTPGFEATKNPDGSYTYGEKIGTGVQTYTASLAAVAEDIGIPAETLKATIMEYDTAYANKDMSELDVPKSAVAAYIGSGRLVDASATTKVLLDTEAQPYVEYLTVNRLASSTHHTMGGLKVDENRHVISTSGNIIPGGR